MNIQSSKDITVGKGFSGSDGTKLAEINGLKDNSQDVFADKLKKAMSSGDEKSLKKTCMEFETIFLNILNKQMKNTVMKSEFLPQSNARDMFESLLDEKLTEESSKAGGIGLGEMLFKQMQKEMLNVYKK